MTHSETTKILRPVLMSVLMLLGSRLAHASGCQFTGQGTPSWSINGSFDQTVMQIINKPATTSIGNFGLSTTTPGYTSPYDQAESNLKACSTAGGGIQGAVACQQSEVNPPLKSQYNYGFSASDPKLSQNTWVLAMFAYESGNTSSWNCVLQSAGDSLTIQKDASAAYFGPKYSSFPASSTITQVIGDNGILPPAPITNEFIQPPPYSINTVAQSLVNLQQFLNNAVKWAPGLYKLLLAKQYDQAFQYASQHSLMRFVDMGVGFQILHLNPLNATDMHAYYAAAQRNWKLFYPQSPEPYFPSMDWSNSCPETSADANLADTKAGGYPNIALYCGHTPPVNFMDKWVAPIFEAALLGTITAGFASGLIGALATTTTTVTAAGATVTTSSIDGVAISSTTAAGTSMTTAGLAVNGIANSVVSSAITTGMNGGSFGQNLMSSLEGAAVGTALNVSGVNSDVTSGLTKAGLNSSVANYAASLATGTVSNTILNGGNINQAFVSAATGTGVGLLETGASKLASMAESPSNPFQPANLQPLSISQLNQNVGAVDLSNIPMPVVNFPTNDASPAAAVDNGSSYSIPADIQAMSGVTDLNLADLNSSLNSLGAGNSGFSGVAIDGQSFDPGTMGAAGVGGTAAAGAGAVLFKVGTTPTDSNLNQLSFETNGYSNAYDNVNWKTKSVMGDSMIYDPSIGTTSQSSYVRYSVNPATDTIPSDYINIEMLRGDPARPGLGSYLLQQVAVENPGTPIYAELSLSNASSFKTAFLNLAASGDPITAESLTNALSSVPAFRTLPGEATLVPTFDASGNLINMGVLRYPDLTANTVSITNAGDLLANPNFQNWMSGLSSQPADYFSSANRVFSAGGISVSEIPSGLASSQGGFLDLGTFADGLSTLGNFGKIALPVALDTVNVAGTGLTAYQVTNWANNVTAAQGYQNLPSAVGQLSFDLLNPSTTNNYLGTVANDYFSNLTNAEINTVVASGTAIVNGVNNAVNMPVSVNSNLENLQQSIFATSGGSSDPTSADVLRANTMGYVVSPSGTWLTPEEANSQGYSVLPTVTVSAPRPTTTSMIGANIANAVSSAYNSIASRVTSAFSTPTPTVNATSRVPASAPTSKTQAPRVTPEVLPMPTRTVVAPVRVAPSTGGRIFRPAGGFRGVTRF